MILQIFNLLITTVLVAAQLSPALVPKQSPKPRLPKVNENACPFEGCQFGEWTVRKPVRLFSTWKRKQTPLRRLAKGEVVRALTGIHITFEPSEISVTAPMPQYGLKPGDTVFGYMNLGEGFFNAWFKGMWVEEFDGSAIVPGCSRNCSARLVKPGTFELWVQLRTRDGVTGWTKETDSFDGKDALGRLMPNAGQTQRSVPSEQRLWTAAGRVRAREAALADGVLRCCAVKTFVMGALLQSLSHVQVAQDPPGAVSISFALFGIE